MTSSRSGACGSSSSASTCTAVCIAVRSPTPAVRRSTPVPLTMASCSAENRPITEMTRHPQCEHTSIGSGSAASATRRVRASRTAPAAVTGSRASSWSSSGRGRAVRPGPAGLSRVPARRHRTPSHAGWRAPRPGRRVPGKSAAPAPPLPHPPLPTGRLRHLCVAAPAAPAALVTVVAVVAEQLVHVGQDLRHGDVRVGRD